VKNLWLRLSKRERVIVSVAALIFVLLLARFFVLNPYLAHRASVAEQLDVRAKQLENHRRYLNRKEEIQGEIAALKTELEELVASLLVGDTPPVIASSLQETVRAIAAREGVQIVATRVLNPEPVGAFLRIPIQMEIDGAMEQVASLIQGIDSGPQLLVVNEITIRSLSPQAARGRPRERQAAGGGVRASMVIAGFARQVNGAEPAKPSPRG